MANTASHPSRIVGWISYFAIESYGSLAVALFWAFSNATVGMELAECDMGSFGGGWTQVFMDNMSPPDPGWSIQQTYNCGIWGQILDTS